MTQSESTETISNNGEPPFAIPGAPRPPKKSLNNSMIWLYGEPKIGKTTTATRFPGTWIIGSEKGQDFVECREPTFINSWAEFKNLARWIVKEQPTQFGDGEPIKFLALDTIDRIFKMCFDYVCQTLGVEDPGELHHGKGWSRLNREFDTVMSYLRSLDYGMIAISHCRSKRVKVRGREMDKWEPNIGAAGFRWCQGASDLILFAFPMSIPVTNDKGEVTGAFEEKRIMLCRPESWAVAGGRMSDRLPKQLPLSYDALMEHFPDTE